MIQIFYMCFSHFFENKISTDLEDFRKYLKIHGVMEYFTKYLSKLKKERPEDPIKMLQDNKDKDMEIEELKKQLAEANAVIF